VTWDVFIFAAPATARTLDEIPLDFDPPPHGPAADVRQRLTAAFPSLDLSDPARGHLTDGRWSIDLNIGRDDPVHAITLHVRGEGDDLLPVIADIAASVGGRAMDVATGEFLTVH
jgi:hypothetical protein